jgi:hypothetical protein
MTDIYSIYETVSYEFNEDKQSLYVRWDKGNDQLHELLCHEVNAMTDNTVFTNLSFVDELKEHIHWEECQTIHFTVSFARFGIRGRAEKTIKISESAYEDEYTFLELNEDGYLYLIEFRGNCIIHKVVEDFTRHKINCYYNELVEERKNYVCVLK